MKTIKVEGNAYKITIDQLLKRGEEDFREVDDTVWSILSDVRARGDQAVLDYTTKFDGVQLDSLKVTEAEIEEAWNIIDDELKSILQEAADNIRSYHALQKEKTWLDTKPNGVILGQLVNPMERVGIYVPGGKAAYPSTTLMNAIPAQVAGVDSIAMVTPPMKNGKINPVILSAAKILGVTEIYKAGGAQSIAALAYGTETIEQVNKIVGPGNIYVARAKKMVFGSVDIDMIAGPSEICVVADEWANPEYIAADLLSQAEHDEMASAVLITSSEDLAQKTLEEVKKQTASASRKEIIEASLAGYGYIFVTENVQASLALANELAPEHLELQLKDPISYLPQVRNAGAVFLGAYAPESVGDYFAGPNHTLPTSGTAKFSSPLGVYDFMKKSSIIYYPKSAFDAIAGKVVTFAESEGLDAHANAMKVRMNNG